MTLAAVVAHPNHRLVSGERLSGSWPWNARPDQHFVLVLAIWHQRVELLLNRAEVLVECCTNLVVQGWHLQTQMMERSLTTAPIVSLQKRVL
jgi:hypothetical protein